MKRIFSLALCVVIFSCNKNIYGIYNTASASDKSAFYQIKLNADNTVEKIELHTIRDEARGTFLRVHKTVWCYFDTSTSHFPTDTVTFRLSDKRLYFMHEGKVNRKAPLLKKTY